MSGSVSLDVNEPLRAVLTGGVALMLYLAPKLTTVQLLLAR